MRNGLGSNLHHKDTAVSYSCAQKHAVNPRCHIALVRLETEQMHVLWKAGYEQDFLRGMMALPRQGQDCLRNTAEHTM